MEAAAPLDEMVDGAGGFRPHWRALLGALADLGAEALAERALLIERFLADEGVTSLLPPPAGDAPPSWRCDPVPLILPAAEFDALEAGLAQRATLLEAVLQDIYGPQHLLAEGALPPALVHANPAFLRPCRNPEGRREGPLLHLYAADLARAPDGSWRVVADRTASPTGLAHVLENRRALARHMPEFLRSLELRRHRPFFDIWQEALQALAPASVEGNPAVALLATGHANPLWFEQVILARELSCALVEGGDLTVRDGALYLKTLRGLEPVDVLLRRQDGRTIDPLELESSMAHGIAGLLDAARGGAVKIVNDPGTGCAEAPGLAAFLPDLAGRLLGEELRIPGARTLWLGDPAARAELGEGLDRWLVRCATDGTIRSIRPAALDPPARAALLRRIAAAPHEFALSEVLRPSVAPCAGPAGLVPRPVMLRLFLVWDGQRWRGLQGGLARVLDGGRGAALSKDVWVPAEDAATIQGPRGSAVRAVAIRRTTADLPSRVADNFFWLGRYLERLESAARLLRAAAGRLGRSAPTPRELAELRSLGACLVRAELLDAETAQAGAAGLGTRALGHALLRAIREGGPVPGLLARVSRLTELLRDRLTGEMQLALHHGLRQLGAQLRAPVPEGQALDRLAEASGAILSFAATVAGLAAENMVRGGGRLFLDLGRRVERAQAVAAELARALDQPGAASQPARLEPGLRLALELRDSVITYRSRYLTALQAGPVLDLVLADEGNPRGLAFQLIAARDMLVDLDGDTESPLGRAAGQLLEDAQAMVREVIAAARAEAMQAELVLALPPRLRAMEGAVADLSNRIARRYFSLLPAVHSLGPTAPDAPLRGAA
ncbi:circularly permuted type 2 ATP-grasp protein [Belnapia sp. T6]|uniref:Circularly permuted type 2 ATP-grasp protein n=1 Tax=Belnapia mucosa TaxID=2804532 RepID=A0ABS1UXK4_9PROT|nr:circularly permuted type 2 ATP-grasp protein [Belnapia mucosa]MBL6454200.1 circularly permuted type 2 ATP-grasp protein [Belnapia mucosa]